jgi:hypothetical protein
VMSSAREFVDQVVCNNAAIHNTERNAWLLGYYLSDARLRLLRVVLLWRPENLDSERFRGYRFETTGPQPTFTPSSWGKYFDVLHYLLLVYESREEHAGNPVTKPLGISFMDPEPKLQPVIVRTTDRDYAIIQSDGSAATFVNGNWQPGITFDCTDFAEMSEVGDPESRTKLLNEASEALAKSLEQ